MTQLVLSTMFAQQERFEDGTAFARFAAEAGYDAIEISHSTPPAKADAIVRAGILPVTSVHAPAPLVPAGDSRTNADLNLASLDAAERSRAVEAAIASIRWAAKAGADRLVVHLGHIESRVLPSLQRELGSLVLGADATSARAGKHRAMMQRARAQASAPHREAAVGSLSQITAVAAEVGIVVGIENRAAYHEIPIPADLATLLTDSPSGYWHDVGHAEIMARLGLVELSDWNDLARERLIGAHIHDVDELTDHRAPGLGDVDFAALAPFVADLEQLTLEIDQRQPDAAVRAVRQHFTGTLLH